MQSVSNGARACASPSWYLSQRMASHWQQWISKSGSNAVTQWAWHFLPVGNLLQYCPAHLGSYTSPWVHRERECAGRVATSSPPQEQFKGSLPKQEHQSQAESLCLSSLPANPLTSSAKIFLLNTSSFKLSWFFCRNVHLLFTLEAGLKINTASRSA